MSSLLHHHKWIESVSQPYRDDWDNEIYVEERLEHELTLRQETSDSKQVYNVAYAAQVWAGRHARTVTEKSFGDYKAAIIFYLELAKKYAPQSVIKNIRGRLKNV
jgi:hypothetical protein